MPDLHLPPLRQLKLMSSGNTVWRYYKSDLPLHIECDFLTSEPFIVNSNNEHYFITSNPGTDVPEHCLYALLATKKPTRKSLNSGEIKLVRWLKHPLFDNRSPNEIIDTWKDKFSFVKENEADGIQGLRPPQLGALHAILSHVENPEERAIVVMPTGTGKTEVMLCALVAIRCNKLLIAVPSDSLRTQLSGKFLSLGLLRQFGVVDDTCLNPSVGVMTSRFNGTQELSNFISATNVVVTTMSILSGYGIAAKNIITDHFSHFIVDEAHHSEAATWKNFIERFDYKRTFLFTATPFRTDEKRLSGKVIFKFSLKNAQIQRYYKEINYLPIREYDKHKADAKIADKAVQQLLEDIGAGYPHIVMARCRDKNRADEVFQHYANREGVSAVVVYTGITALKEKIRAIKDKRHNVVVCVDMLGEGFDLPELKIAAIHDERQSIPITLQFVGRFTRTSYNTLGKASFVTNIAYPPIKNELDQLYAKDSDWNLILPTISDIATQRELNFKEFLDGFSKLEESNIPFQSIFPTMSTVVYVNEAEEWSPNNWKAGIPGIDNYDHQYANYNPHNSTLVIILGKLNNVEWGRFDTVQNVSWDMIVVHWDLRPGVNRIFVNASDTDFKERKLVEAIFGDNVAKITGMEVFRIFHDVNRLAVQNFGGRKAMGQDITFQSFFGKGVQDGLRMLEQGTLIKNNIFGIGFRDGDRVSLGCSVKGKMWSYLRGSLDDLVAWCRYIGETVTNPAIDPNTVLQHTLFPITITERPLVVPVNVEWHHDMLAYPEQTYRIQIDGAMFDLASCELNILDETAVHNALRFSLDTDDHHIVFEMEIGETDVDGVPMAYHKIRKLTPIQVHISYRSVHLEPIEEFFQELTPFFWFVDGSQLFQTRYVRLREQVDHIPLENIITDPWPNVSLQRESQGVAPYITDSIQYYFVSKILPDFEVVYDDDGSGEIADIVAINDNERHIDISLYHLKYALNGQVGNNIDNFYQVCGQAQKSLNWKYRKGKDFFDHLLKRITKKENGVESSRLIKGSIDQLESLLASAKWEKEMRFQIYIVQPSLRKANASQAILQLLGTTYHYLHTVGNVELKVFSS